MSDENDKNTSPGLQPAPDSNEKKTINKKLLGGIIGAVLALALAFGGWKYWESRQVPIAPDSPAAALLRDDDAEEKKTPKLFLRINTRQNITRSNDKQFHEYSVTFSIDENSCKRYYSQRDGVVQCRNNWEFLNPNEQDWKFSPNVDNGTWKFAKNRNYSYTAKHTVPLDNLSADSKYNIYLPEKLGTGAIIASSKSIEFTTQPLNINISNMHFVVDPQNPRNMYFTGSIDSNYALDIEDLKSKLTIGHNNFKVGKTEITPNKLKTGINITVPVLSLPPKSESGTISLAQGVSRINGKDKTKTPLKRGVTVPGQDVFVSGSSIDTTVVTDDDLNSQQVLYIEFTRNVRVDEAQKSVTALMLPLYRTESERKQKKPTNWNKIPNEQIGADILSKSTPIKLEPLANSKRFDNIIAFKYAVESGRYMYIRGEGGAESDTDYKLRSWRGTSRAPYIQPELRIMQKGTILSMGGAKKLAIVSRSLDRIDIKAYRVRPDYINLLVTQSTDSIDQTELDDYNTTLSMDDISEVIESKYTPKSTSGHTPDYHAVDISPLLSNGAKGIFRIEMRGYKNKSHMLSESRFLLVTDLGITVKLSKTGERDVFISSFAKGGPVAGVRVQAIGRNGLPLFSKHTDAQGKVSLPSLSGFYREKKPVAIIASKGNDLTYMPLYDYSREVSLSKFPATQGRNINRDGISVFAFSERGIFRPGENLRFGIIAKPGNWQPKEIAGLPVVAELFDPRGNKIFEKKIVLDENGIADLDIGMKETYPTGRYNLDIKLNKSVIGSVNTQVEEFQPDNLKVVSSFKGLPPSGAKGWVLPEDIAGNVHVENLYGTAAVGNRVEADISLTPVRLSFPKFRDYTFYDPSKEARNYNTELGSVTTDEKGDASFAISMDQYKSGTYRLTLEAQAFETGGGRGVTSYASLLVSPYKKIIGWNSTAKLSFLGKDSEAKVKFIAIDPKLEQTEFSELRMVISEVEYVASLVRDSSGNFRYDMIRKLKEVQNQQITIGKEGLEISLPTSNTGEYRLSIVDNKDFEICNLGYLVAGGSQRRFGLERDAVLRIHLDRKEYNANDEMKLFISAPYAGSGLITLESDKVIAHQWFKADTSDSVHTIKVPSNFEGRAFVSVSLVRDIESDAVHSTPYTFAITPFVANIEKRNLGIKVETPERVMPGDTLTMKVSAKKEGKVIVYAVSEGILQLTSYRTPSPLDFFLRQNPLSVSTMQTLDLIMPEYYLMNRSAFGGDEQMAMAEAMSQLNPFKRKAEPSVVYWSGVVDVGPDGKELKWEVPSYFNGSLRVMAIAAAPDSVGEFVRETKVRGPLIITPDLPVAVAPGDEFEVTAAIANNVDDSGTGLKINVQIDLDDGLSFVKQPEKSVNIDEGREGKIVFRVKANDRLGESIVKISAWVDGKEDEIHVKRPVSMSIRPASPRMSSFKAGYVKGKEQEVSVGRSMYPQFAEVESSLSGLPLPMVDALSGFLMRFPHGCTEQILATAFPYAVLHKSQELLPIPKGQTPEIAREKAIAAINRGIITLSERQVHHGRFSLWPYERNSYPFLTVYSFDYLLSARDAGFSVPEDLLQSVKQETYNILQSLPNSYESAQTISYAAWVYTRSGQHFTGLPQLVKHMDQYLKGWRETSCASLLAGSYRLMQLHKEAEELIKGVNIKPSSLQKYRGWFYNPLWDNGLHLTMLSLYFPDMLSSPETQRLLVAVLNDIYEGRYTTSSSVQAIRGITAYATANISNKLELKMVALDNKKAVLPFEASGNLVKRLSLGNEPEAFRYSGAEGLFWQITTDGFDLKPDKAKAKKINLNIKYIPAKGKKLEDLSQGDEVYVLLTASASSTIDNVAITSLIPGGFEMVISKGGSIVGGGASSSRSRDYGEDDYDEDDYPEEYEDSSYSNDTIAYPNQAHINDVQKMLSEAGLAGSPMQLVHVERREDRMVAFTTLNKSDSVFIYRIKAINKGKYTLPVVYAEALYDPDARANTSPGVIEVK